MRETKYQKNRNSNLDLIRILACISVVGLHTLREDLSILNSSLYYLCGFAVPAFFMASGYMLLVRDKIDLIYSVRKIINILRIVIFWNMTIFMIDIVLAIYRGQKVSASWFGLFWIDLLRGLIQKGPLWHFWYFGALIILYILLYPLFDLLHVSSISEKNKRLVFLWSICMVLSIVLQGTSIVAEKPLQKYCIQTFRLWTWMQYFMLGGVLHSQQKNWEKIHMKIHTGLLIVVTVWILIYQNLAARFLIHNMRAEYFYDDMFTILWISLLFTWIMRLRIDGNTICIIQELAPLTVGVYIVHPFIIRAINHFRTISTVPESIVFFLIVLVSALVMVWIMKKIPIVKMWVEL